jgi:hypothetical protein
VPAERLAEERIGGIDDLPARDHPAERGIRARRVVGIVQPEPADGQIVNVIGHR